MARSILASTLFFLTLLLTYVTSARAASNSTQCPSDPYLDPRNDPCNALGYIANNTPTAIAFVYVIGFEFRFALHYNPDSLGIYIAEYLMIVLSPCFFIATNYVLLGRLAREIDCVHRVLIPVRRLTLIFVLSDAAGASITTSTVYSSALTGFHVFLAGLVFQLASVGSFCVIYARFLYKVHAEEPAIWMQDSKQQWNGSSETAFYVGDTLPLFVVIVIYVPFWPGRFITAKLAPSVNELQNGRDLSLSRGILGYNHEVPSAVLDDY
ncbi:RTA1-like protein [Suillus subalutaceus]|uniref:RTA1-like protein n=1 Tax=Suillus subalutaceus TaxID=48586 RepID=UPI001B8625BC|nr:RTA1-like protein [Suillus subalutaceus]KAG1851292.1 RTA1-like protein [Suillus subalutaceus]